MSNLNIWSPNPELREKETLSTDFPLVIFLDGKGIVRDHISYDLTEMNSIPFQFSKAAEETAIKLRVHTTVYTATDEISFIFPDPSELFSALALPSDTYRDYILSDFLQNFLFFQREYNQIIQFHTTMFYLQNDLDDGDVIQKYLGERKKQCQDFAIKYYARQYLTEEECLGLTAEEIRPILEKKKLWDDLLKHDRLYNGILKEFPKDIEHIKKHTTSFE